MPTLTEHEISPEMSTPEKAVYRQKDLITHAAKVISVPLLEKNR